MSDTADTFVMHGPITMADVVLPKPADGAAPSPHPYRPLPAEPSPIGDVTTARAIETAERLIANGTDPARVRAALIQDGIDPDLLDSGTAEERAHDRAHGLQQYIDPQSYSFAIGSPTGVENVAALN